MANRLTLLKMVQKFCARRGLPIPPTVYTYNSDTIRQIVGLLEETIQELARAWDWPELKRTITFNHADGTDYLAYSFGGDDPAIENVLSMKNRTLWDLTNRRPVYGPMTDEDWQSMISLTVNPAVYNYRIAGDGIQIYPVPTDVSAVEFGFQGVLTLPIEVPPVNLGGTTYYSDFFTKDTDLCLLDYHLVMLGLRWRWNKEKGLPYAEERAEYDRAVVTAQSDEGSSPTISMDSCKPFPQIAKPGLLIPAGNWDV